MPKAGQRQVKFGDVVRLSKTRCQDPLGEGYERFVGLEHLEPGNLRIRSWGNVADGVTFTNVFKPGQVLFGKRRAYQRKVAIADFTAVCSGDIYVLESADPAILLPELLPFLCQTDDFFEHAVGTSAGSLSPRTNWSSLASFEFALPKIEDQIRISNALRAGATVVEKQSEALSALGITRKANLDYLLATNDPTDLICLGQVASMQNGRPFPGDEYETDGVKLLRPGNLDASGFLFWGNDKTVFLDPKWNHAASDFLINPGDVVINLTAQSLEDGFMGRVCLAKDSDASLLNQRIGRFRCDESALLPEFLFRALQTSRFRQHAHANCEGSKVKHLFWQHLAKYEIFLPTLEIQSEISEKCAEVDDAISSLTARLKASKSMQALMVNELWKGPEDGV